MIARVEKILFIGIGGFVCLVVLISTGLLIHGVSGFKIADNRLIEKRNELMRFYEYSNPFPVKENLQKEIENLEKLTQWFNAFMAEVSTGQEEFISNERSPSIFIQELGKKSDALKKKAGGRVYDKFAFGMEMYLSGDRPDPEDVPRLMEQLIILEKLCSQLLDAGCDKIDRVLRDQFEKIVSKEEKVTTPHLIVGLTSQLMSDQAKKALFSKDAGIIPEGKLFGKYHFVLEFHCKEDVLWKYLNHLLKNKMFIIISGLDVSVEGESVLMPKNIGEKEKATLEIKELTRRERIVSGPELSNPLKVILDVDVLKFAYKK